jgi:hypothetical protein
VLPPEFTQVGTRSLRVVLNPLGANHVPECDGCDGNNTVVLPGVGFERVQERAIKFRVYITLLAYRDAAGEVVIYAPSRAEIAKQLRSWLTVWPVDPDMVELDYRYIVLSQQSNEPRHLVDPPIRGFPQWDNAVVVADSKDIYDYRPSGSPAPYGLIWTAFSSDSWMGCHGHGGASTPLFHGGTCSWTVAHEAAHTKNLGHAYEAWSPEADYPGSDRGEVESNVWGFDVYNGWVYPPTQWDGEPTWDLMSYEGGTHFNSLWTWIGCARASTSQNASHHSRVPRPACRSSSC